MDFSFHESDFYKQAQQVIQSYNQWPIQQHKYPFRLYTDKGDEFYSLVWQQIDSSRQYCWILTYAMDSSLTANITLRKLINAAQRGVDVVLFVDDLTQYADKNLINKFTNAGGKFVSLNPTFRQYYLIPSQECFRRHHEKLMIIDENATIGSANIEASYGGPKYGSMGFYDMNLFTSGNINVEQFKQYFIRVANLYNIPMKDHEISSVKPLPPHFKFLKTHQPAVREIQDEILNSIREAQEKIIIVQPYYYPIRIFEQELIKAMHRGVKVELITSAKRDQPVYHHLKNFILLRNLFHPNMSLYEYPEQFLHMKGYLIDDRKFNIGSFNNDRWSWKLNNEVNIVLDDEEEAKKFNAIIQNCKEYSHPVELTGSIGVWRYTKMKYWELFLYLSELVMNKYQYKRIYQEWDESLGNDF